MIDILGWMGAFFYSICVIPQCIKVYRTKSAKDFAWMYFVLWGLGATFSFTYVLITNIMSGEYQPPLLCNYLFNFVCLTYLAGSKVIYDKRT